MKDKSNADLSNCLSLSKFEKAKIILQKDESNINILYKDGIFFDLVISKNNLDMLKALLEFAKANDVDSLELQKILTKIIEDVDLSPEMKEVLSPYVCFEDSKHSDSLLDAYQDSLKHQTNFTIIKRAHSADDLTKSNNSSGTKIQLSEESIEHWNHDTQEQQSYSELAIIGHANDDSNCN